MDNQQLWDLLPPKIQEVVLNEDSLKTLFATKVLHNRVLTEYSKMSSDFHSNFGKIEVKVANLLPFTSMENFIHKYSYSGEEIF